jgi:hypothetical protein
MPSDDALLFEPQRGDCRPVVGGTRPLHRRQLGLAAVATILLIATLGFTIGQLLMPPQSPAATSISIAARPTVVTAGIDTVELYGTIASGTAGEDVSVEANECGSHAGFHLIGGTQTAAGGAWLTKPSNLYPAITTVYRARWKDRLSDTITVRVHPQLFLQNVKGLFHLTVRAQDIFRGERAVVERLQGRRWVRVKSIVLTSFGGYNWGGQARFRVSQQHGTPIRVVLPQAQVGRCFLPGFSNIVRA